MVSKIIFGFLIAVLLLGISSNTTISAQPTNNNNKAVINLNDFNDINSDDRKTLEGLLEKCPYGLILYPLNGQDYIICFTTPVSGKLLDTNGKSVVNIDIDVNNNNHHNSKHHHNHDDNNKTDTGPDKDCLFNTSLPKCAPDKDGNCPDGFATNGYGQCFMQHPDGCPNGSHSVDDDETGQCYDNDDVDCPDGMELNGKNCTYIDEEEPVITTTPQETSSSMVEETQEDPSITNDDKTTIIDDDTETTNEDDSVSDSVQQQEEEDNSNRNNDSEDQQQSSDNEGNEQESEENEGGEGNN